MDFQREQSTRKTTYCLDILKTCKLSLSNRAAILFCSKESLDRLMCGILQYMYMICMKVMVSIYYIYIYIIGHLYDCTPVYSSIIHFENVLH